ncbi:MAG: hypothetical protein KDB03_21120 [Planctomycetales bacterium]|nr:hypothetical protein [Planctomycetales bacterium]
MSRVLFTSDLPAYHWQRLAIAARDEYEILFCGDGSPVNAWIVYDSLPETMTQTCPSKNTVLILPHASELSRLSVTYTNQFGILWTPDSTIRHPRRLLRPQYPPWQYGLHESLAHGAPLNMADLAALDPPTSKPKLLSVICDGTALTYEQRHARKFVDRLALQFGAEIDVFLQLVPNSDSQSARYMKLTRDHALAPEHFVDRADVIWPYKYHLVIEASRASRFMSELLADAFLGWSYPIYFGGAEAYHQFPEGSFLAIDIHAPDTATAMITDVLRANTYESSLARLDAARQHVIKNLNIFSVLSEFLHRECPPSQFSRVTLLPPNRRARLFFHSLRNAFQRRLAPRVA